MFGKIIINMCLCYEVIDFLKLNIALLLIKIISKLLEMYVQF